MTINYTTEEPREKNSAAVELGRRGGLTKPTKPRGFASMSPERRRKLGKRGGRAKARNAIEIGVLSLIEA